MTGFMQERTDRIGTYCFTIKKYYLFPIYIGEGGRLVGICKRCAVSNYNFKVCHVLRVFAVEPRHYIKQYVLLILRYFTSLGNKLCGCLRVFKCLKLVSKPCGIYTTCSSSICFLNLGYFKRNIRNIGSSSNKL